MIERVIGSVEDPEIGFSRIGGADVDRDGRNIFWGVEPDDLDIPWLVRYRTE